MKKQAKSHRRLQQKPLKRRFKLIGLICLAVFVQFLLMNGLLALVTSGRTYPMVKSYTGLSLGAMAGDDVLGALRQHAKLPSSVTLTSGNQRFKASPQALGLSVDHEAMSQRALQHDYLPVVEFIWPRTIDLILKVDAPKFKKELARLTKPLQKDSQNAAIIIKNGQFDVQPEQVGVIVNAESTKDNLYRALATNQTQVIISTSKKQPVVVAKDLETARQELEQQTQTVITLTFQDKKVTPIAADKTVWFATQDTTMQLSSTNIEAYVRSLAQSWNMQMTNLPGVVEAIQMSMSQKKAATIALQGSTIARASKAFTYCVAAKEVDVSLLQDMSRKLQNTLADSRGWSLGGAVTFVQVERGCQFTVWLSKAELLPTFSSGCSAQWSCRAGSNVIFNLDRWQGASASWNAAGGSLDAYQTMVINHEVGHWLGFDHYDCPGAGQPAPVMQQQSIDLQGCAFSVWPTAMEVGVLRQRLGV